MIFLIHAELDFYLNSFRKKTRINIMEKYIYFCQFSSCYIVQQLYSMIQRLIEESFSNINTSDPFYKIEKCSGRNSIMEEIDQWISLIDRNRVTSLALANLDSDEVMDLKRILKFPKLTQNGDYKRFLLNQIEIEEIQRELAKLSSKKAKKISQKLLKSELSIYLDKIDDIHFKYEKKTTEREL